MARHYSHDNEWTSEYSKVKVGFEVPGLISVSPDRLQGSGKVTSMHYLLSDGVHAMAEIPSTDTVLLWLGVSLLVSWSMEYHLFYGQQCHNYSTTQDCKVVACARL